ncbi:MAG TPA: BlaI/MecI/CopY family transcriptional regulator [Thermoanaerobaculia bacterium]|nr:BlaI/MecI/CopY family transcriptional regulator [Thermoanaerobaculia bacterium]
MRPSATDPDLPKISAAEWPVAEAIWSAGRPVSSTEIVARVSGGAVRHPKTVRTLLRRLLDKRVLATERRGRVSYFFPRLSRSEYVELESRSLLDRLFDGRRAALVLHFLRDGNDLSPAELASLRERLAELESSTGSSSRGPRQ